MLFLCVNLGCLCELTNIISVCELCYFSELTYVVTFHETLCYNKFLVSAKEQNNIKMLVVFSLL